MRYINAADILPEHLLREVQKYWQGIIYVSRPESLERVKFSKEIRVFILKGFSAKDVANVCNISVRRVYDIAKQLGESNPYRRDGHRKPRVAPTVNDGTNDGTFRQSPSDAQKSPLKRGKTRTPRK